MFALKKIVTSLLLPPVSLILLALFGLWWMRRHPRSGRALVAVSLLALLVLSVPRVGGRLLATLEIYPPLPPAQLHKAQAIVVLGGGIQRNAAEYGGDTVSRYSLERVRYAALLYRQQALPILLSGGAPQGGKAEAPLMQAVLEKEFRVPVRWAEAQSLDTADNARLSARLLRDAGIKEIVLVSHAWHLRRAVPLFEAQGFVVHAAPTLAHRDNDDWMQFLPGRGMGDSVIALHEWLGFLAKSAQSMSTLKNLPGN